MIQKKLTNKFVEIFGNCENSCTIMAPGRINLIGEHTDYNDGFVLPMTIDRAVYIILRRRTDKQCNFFSLNFNEAASWNLKDIRKEKQQHWANYLKGMLATMLAAGFEFDGVDGVVYGDVPLGSGLSSSAALEIATAFGIEQTYHLDISPLQMIHLAKKCENEFVGVNCGIMDQFVSRLGKKDHALFLDCRTLKTEHVPINFEQHVLLIANSKVKRELAKSAYNERCAECSVAVAYFQKLNPGITKLRDISWKMLEQNAKHLDTTVYKRARHVISENQRVLAAVTALQNNALLDFGELLFASHLSLKQDYAVSCEELDFLVDSAKSFGAAGARLTGAGFGGSALILAAKNDAEIISQKLSDSYANKFGFAPEITILKNNFETGII